MREGLRLAHILHRLSGLALALFLPLHFWVLGLAMRDTDRLDSFLALTQRPLVKAAEVVLVFLLAVHLFGGLRLMALDWLGWRPGQKTAAAVAAALGCAAAGLFLLRAI